MECKTAFGRVLKPTIYIYTDMHILPSVYIVSYSTQKCVFLCTSFSFFILIRLLKKEIKEKLLSSHSLFTSYCKTNVSKINTSTVQSLDTFSVIENLHKPREVPNLIRVSNTGGLYEAHPMSPFYSPNPSNNAQPWI